MKRFKYILPALALGLGSAVSGGCVAAPAIMLTSAAVTAGALVSEGERLVQYPDTETTAIVRNDGDGESACTRTCQRREDPLTEDEPGA